jgi:hypothetical protein
MNDFYYVSPHRRSQTTVIESQIVLPEKSNERELSKIVILPLQYTF